MKKLSFAKGALILSAATALGKIFSAIFKIPLDRFLLHEEGMALFNSCYNTYTFFFALAQSGFPLAISQMIASSSSKKDEDTILSTSLVFLLGTFGISCAFIMLFCKQIANAASLPDSALGFCIMAPALLFCALTAVLKGFFQGKMMMFPPAVGQVCDSFARLIIGFSAAYLFLDNKIQLVSSAALFGVPTGAFLCAAVLLFSYFSLSRPLRFSFSTSVLKKLLFLAVPITVTTSLHAIFNMIDTFEVVSSLEWFSYAAPSKSFGILGRAAMLYALPVSIATAVASSVLPALAENIKLGNMKKAKSDCSLALRLSLVISLPCAAGFIAMGDDIFALLFDSSDLSSLLALIAPSSVFLSFSCVACGILQASGKTKHTLFASVVAILLKLSLTPILIKFFGINGSAAATSISYFVLLAILCACILNLKTFTLPISDFVLKPAICTFCCFIVAKICSEMFSSPIAIALAALVYIPSIFITRFITKNELKQIFGG